MENDFVCMTSDSLTTLDMAKPIYVVSCTFIHILTNTYKNISHLHLILASDYYMVFIQTVFLFMFGFCVCPQEPQPNINKHSSIYCIHPHGPH